MWAKALVAWGGAMDENGLDHAHRPFAGRKPEVQPLVLASTWMEQVATDIAAHKPAQRFAIEAAVIGRSKLGQTTRKALPSGVASRLAAESRCSDRAQACCPSAMAASSARLNLVDWDKA